MNEEKKCNCEDTCTCGCQEGQECTCHEDTCQCDGACKHTDTETDTCHNSLESCDCHSNDSKKCKCKDDDHKEHKKDHDKKDHDKKEKYKKEIKKLEETVKELEEKNLRAKAELINYRKRKEEETTRLLKYSNEDLIKQILPVIDNFERAIKMDDDNLEDQLSKFLEGFKMIYCNLVSTLESFGVKAIDGANKPFDPTYHEAVMTEKKDAYESGMVIEVLQKGYILKDKVIRPAMVKVSE